MANEGNTFNKEEVILFEQVLQEFDTDNTIAKQAARFTQPGTEMQRRGDRVWRPAPQIAVTVDGLNIESLIGEITQMSVPADLTTIANVPWQLNAKEMRDPLYRDRKAKAGAQALSARINRQMANLIVAQGSLFHQAPLSGLNDGFNAISFVDALYMSNDIVGEKTMVLNPTDYNAMAGGLAQRTLMPRSEKALSTTNLGPVAGFNTFKTAFGPPLGIQTAGGGITISGNQKHIPTSQVDAADFEGSLNEDNRFFDVLLSSTTNIKVGDKFTVAGVNALSHINKSDTQALKTFSVVKVTGLATSTIRIAPPPIVTGGGTKPEDDYANVTKQFENGDALVFLNTLANKLTNPFFINDSIEVFGGRLAFDEDMAGVAVMRQMTDTGIEIIFAKQGNVQTGASTYRLTIFFGVTNLNPEMNGILIGS